VKASVQRARRLRGRLGDIGVRVLDEVVSQLARHPVQTRSKDLFRRAQQLRDRVFETFPGPRGRPSAPDPSPEDAPRTPAQSLEAESAGSAPSPSATDRGSAPTAPPPSESAPAAPPPRAAAAPAREAGGPSPDRTLPATSGPSESPALRTARPGHALIADASWTAPEPPDDDTLRLLVRDPTWGYLSWEIGLERIGAAAAGMNRAEARLEVRETGSDADRPALDEPVAPATGRYFFRWPRPGRRYRAVLYVAAADGRRVELARSGDVDVPEPARAAPSSPPSARFAVSHEAADRLDGGAPPPPREAPEFGWGAAAHPAGAPSKFHEADTPAGNSASPSGALGASQLVPTSWAGGASQLVPTSGAGGASQLAPTSGAGGASQLAPTSGAGGASQLVPTSWTGGASQLVPTSWAGGASQLVPTSWAGGASQLAPTSWAGGASQLVPTSWAGGASQLVPTSWAGGASQLVPTSWAGGASQLVPTSGAGGASQLVPTSGAGGASSWRPTSWTRGAAGKPSPWAGPRPPTPEDAHRDDARGASPATARVQGPRPGPVDRFPELVSPPTSTRSKLVSIEEAARWGLVDRE